MKENENANARSSRVVARTKPASVSGTAGLTGATGGVTRATAASRAKASGAADSKADLPGKRKREALGEVVAPNKPSTLAAKGKGKEIFDGVVLKPKSTATTATATRQPLRTVASTRQTAVPAEIKKTTVKQTKVETELVATHDEEDAMAVDPPVALPRIAVRKSTLKETTTTTARRTETNSRRTSLRSAGPVRNLLDEEEEEPVHKKRRTSSIPPEEDPQAIEEARLQTQEEIHHARLMAEIEVFANEEEADPESSNWDDLDADDADDPLMVSEYVQEIFEYLKQVEVFLFIPIYASQLANQPPAADHDA